MNCLEKRSMGNNPKYEYFYDYIIKVLSVAKVGKLFSKDPYALDNYNQLEVLSMEMLKEYTHTKIDRINYFSRDVYPTPNVSCRCCIFNEEGKILLVKEKSDGGYSLPGGWCDLFDSPIEAIKSECLQEAGVKIKDIHLVGIINKINDKNEETNFLSVPEYQITFKAKSDKFETFPHLETSDVAWFKDDELPLMSKKCSIKDWKRAIEHAKRNDIFCD